MNCCILRGTWIIHWTDNQLKQTLSGLEMQRNASPCGRLSFVWHEYTCRIFNHFHSWKTSKAAFGLSRGPASWVLTLGSQEWAPAWFTVSTNGFRRNIWTWSSEKSLVPVFFWWFLMNTPFERVPNSPLGHEPPRLLRLLHQEPRKIVQMKVQTYLLLLIPFYICTHLTHSRYLWNGNRSCLNVEPLWQAEQQQRWLVSGGIRLSLMRSDSAGTNWCGISGPTLIPQARCSHTDWL